MTNSRMEPLQAWALIVPKGRRVNGHDARVRGGDSRCDIFWTRASAVKFRRFYREGEIIPVVVNQVFGK